MRTPFKGILIIGAGIVRDLDASPARARVIKQVNVRPLVKPVMARLGRLWRVKVVHIAKAAVVSETVRGTERKREREG